ncbi:universal stress protein [Dietzia sp.]|uniref:universal stress protein n=1 Tax=Dietzia sp. TaxID=1871616 RepID=UPI002FD9F1FF
MSAYKGAVVVGVDGSDVSKAAVAYAAKTAAGRGIGLHIVMAYSAPTAMFSEGMVPPHQLVEHFEKEAEPVVQDAMKIARETEPELKITGAVAEGNPAQLLIEYSREAKIVVLGTRGLGALKGVVLGSVSAHVATNAFCPVIVTKADTADNVHSDGPVVVGVDGSDNSVRATEWAFSEAKARGAHLLAVHTWIDPEVQAAAAGIILSEDDLKRLSDEQRGMLEDALGNIKERYPEVEVDTLVTEDRATRILVEKSKEAQLVVVGSHGRGTFTGMLLGSTSRSLLQASYAPVMVVRPAAAGCEDE